MGAAKLKSEFVNECFALLQHVVKDEGDLDARRRLGAVLGGSLSNPSRSDINESFYSRVLTHEDRAVAQSAHTFFDKFLSWGFQPGVPGGHKSLSFCVALDVRRQASDIIGEFDNLGGLDVWLADKLDVSVSRIRVFPEPMAPWSLLPSITVQTYQMFAAKTWGTGALLPRNRRQSDDAPPGTDLRLFYVDVLATKDGDEVELSDKIVKHASVMEPAPSFDAQYTVAGTACSACVRPVRMGLPFSMARHYAFLDGEESFLSRVAGLDAANLSLHLAIGSWASSDMDGALDGIGFRLEQPNGSTRDGLFFPLSAPFLNTLAAERLFQIAKAAGIGFLAVGDQKIPLAELSANPLQVAGAVFAQKTPKSRVIPNEQRTN